MRHLLFIFLVLSLFLISGCSSENNPSQSLSGQSAAEAPTSRRWQGEVDTTLRELLGANAELKCLYSVRDANGTQENVMYMGGQRLRVDTAVQSENGDFQSYLIFDGRYAYSWNDQVKGSGSKNRVELSSLPPRPGAATSTAKRVINFDARIKMQCDEWTVDQSLFARPDNIKFVDPVEEEAKRKPDKPKTAACQICERMKTAQEKFNCERNFCREEE